MNKNDLHDSFPLLFLHEMSKEYDLSQAEEAVFLLRWGGGLNKEDISKKLHIETGACQKRMGYIYSKFEISGNGRGKDTKLTKILREKFQEYCCQHPENRSINSLDDFERENLSQTLEKSKVNINIIEREPLEIILERIIEKKLRNIFLNQREEIINNIVNQLEKIIKNEFEEIIMNAISTKSTWTQNYHEINEKSSNKLEFQKCNSSQEDDDLISSS